MATANQNFKKSISPLATEDIEILILGSMPGDASIAKGEYYAHPRNRFWKIIAEITENNLPSASDEKKALLKRHKIGLWDVAEEVNRKGSLDADILDATPNNLAEFIGNHKNIKVIAFNGAKAMNLYTMFFDFDSDITYLKLPSSSSANAGINFKEICRQWKQVFS